MQDSARVRGMEVTPMERVLEGSRESPEPPHCMEMGLPAGALWFPHAAI